MVRPRETLADRGLTIHRSPFTVHALSVHALLVSSGVYSIQPTTRSLNMGVSYTGTLVRSGTERATLVRRTYGLVFASIFITAGAVVATQQSPALMGTVAAHPIITFLVMFGSL